MRMREDVRPAGELLSMSHVAREYLQGAGVVHALRGVTLSVHAGELVAIMGPSGSGKSTLMMLAAGLDRPTRGSVRVDGIALDSLNPAQLAVLRRERVGVVFQDYNLLPSLTAGENVSLPLELGGEAARAAARVAAAALETVGMGGLSRRFPDELSGGQRQRVAIARSLVGTRRLLLADEPTGALDSATGAEVLEVLRERVDDGAAAVVVTHDSGVASKADRTIVLRDGLVEDEVVSAGRDLTLPA